MPAKWMVWVALWLAAICISVGGGLNHHSVGMSCVIFGICTLMLGIAMAISRLD